MLENYEIKGAPHYLDTEDKTLVILQRDEPYRYLTVKVQGDIRSLSDVEIKHETLEQLYKEEFAERANEERFDDLLNQNSELKSQLDLMNQATMEIAMMVAGLVGGAE